MPSTFDAIYRSSIVPTLLDLFADREDGGALARWKFHAAWPPTGDPASVVVHAGNVETRVEDFNEREKRVSERLILLTRDPDNEAFPGLAHVPKSGVFESPPSADGTVEFWAVIDDETDSRSPNLHRLRCQQAQWRKTDGYAER